MASAGGSAVAVLEPRIQPIDIATPPPKAGGLKKVSFGKIAVKKEETKTVYPLFPDPEFKASEIASRILERTEQFEALKGALETDKSELKFMVAPHYFKVNRGIHEVPSSIAVHKVDDDGKMVSEVLVTFQNRYSLLPDEACLLPILGDRTAEFFRQTFELKIKGDSIPEEKSQDLMNELQTLFAKYNCTEALEVKEGVKPVKEFHAARHLQLTPEVNLALDEACPIVAMVKTKGRK